jgi:hypothetical protein
LSFLKKILNAFGISNAAYGRQHFPKSKEVGLCFVPLIRGPLFLVDPRSQFLRRGPIPKNLSGASQDHFPPRNVLLIDPRSKFMKRWSP